MHTHTQLKGTRLKIHQNKMLCPHSKQYRKKSATSKQAHTHTHTHTHVHACMRTHAHTHTHTKTIGSYNVIITQLITEQLDTLISACWATVDWSWPKKWDWYYMPELISTSKKKNQAENKSLNLPPKSSHVRKKPPPLLHLYCVIKITYSIHLYWPLDFFIFFGGGAFFLLSLFFVLYFLSFSLSNWFFFFCVLILICFLLCSVDPFLSFFLFLLHSFCCVYHLLHSYIFRWIILKWIE